MLKVKENAKTRMVIVAMLAILLILMVMFITMKRGIPMVWDTWFHIGRIYDIREAFKAHSIPTWVNFDSYFGMGQAINGMYPDITLWPFVFVTNGLSFVNQIIAIRVLMLMLTFLVTYVSLVQHKFTKENSFYAAIVYAFSGYSLYQFLYELQPGAIIIYAFTFPLIFVIKEALYAKNIDRRLIVKLSLLFGIALYSHLLSAVVIACLVIALWFVRILFEKELNYFSILNLSFASILTLLYAMPVLYRVYIISKSKIAPPFGKGIIESENIIDVFNNPQIYARTSLSLVALVLFILSLHYFRKSIEITRLLIAEMVIIILCTNLIPWDILGKLPLINMLQSAPRRFGIYLSALPILAFLYTRIKNKNIILFGVALISLIAVPGVLKQGNSVFKVSQCIFLNSKNIKENNSDRNFDLIIRDYLPAKILGNSTDNETPDFVNEQSLHPKMEGKLQKVKIKKNVQEYGSISLYNQSSAKKGIYSIPVYDYPSLNYQLQINGKEIRRITQSRHGFMQIRLDKSLPKNSKVTITYNNPKAYNVLLIVSISFYLIVFVYFMRISLIAHKQ